MLFKPRIILLLCVVSRLICPRAFAEEGTPDNFKNPIAVQEVLAGKRTVANAAWWGFDKGDSTAALQGAIYSGAGKVIVPYMSSDWVVRPIKLSNNLEIFFEPGVVVRAKEGEFRGKNDCLFKAVDKHNITLQGYGATLCMQKQDYTGHDYAKSEWRTILAFYGCSSVKVLGLTLKDSGGDGIYVGSGSTREGIPLPCRNVLIKDCICDNSYRQGISVISAENLLIENCILRNTKGAPPSAGIDLEPNNERDRLINVVISNCISEGNSGPGLQVYLRKLSAKSKDVSILFANCYVSKCGGTGLLISAIKDDGPQGLIEFKNCTVEETTAHGLYIWDKSANRANLRFDNCKWRDVARRGKYAPIYLFLDRADSTRNLGGVEFVNCYVYDDKNRPFLVASERGQGVYNVRGDISVYNPYGAKMDLGKKNKAIDLRVTSMKE